MLPSRRCVDGATHCPRADQRARRNEQYMARRGFSTASGVRYLGILSAGIAVAGVVQRCKRPKALQAQKAAFDVKSFMPMQHRVGTTLRDVDASLRCHLWVVTSLRGERPGWQMRAFDAVHRARDSVPHLGVHAKAVERATAITSPDPPAHACPGADPPNAHSTSRYEGCDPLVPFACALLSPFLIILYEDR